MLVIAALPVRPARAALDTCNVDVSPHSVAPGSDTGFSFGIYNSNDNDIAWLQVTRPPGTYVTLESAGASGWQGDITSADTATFTAGSLPHGFSQGFSVQAMPNMNGGPVNWGVQVSDDPSGAGAIDCTGDTSLTIMTQPSVINISNVRVTNVGPTNATILWDTDVASTSQVAYGLDNSYGSNSALNGSLVTSHNVKLTGLTPNTGYHFAVTSTTPADGGTATSADNTLLTAVEPPVVVPVVTPGGGSTGTGTVTAPTGVPTEKVPPGITITTKLAPSYAAAPKITGVATDDTAVAKVEYSIDDGKNWLPVDSMTPQATTTTTGTGRNKKTTTTTSAARVSFSFVPVTVDEGNYSVIARATDPSGNQAATAPLTLVIDRLPPRFGPSVVTIGPQMIEPAPDGKLVLPAGLDYKMSVSLVGGPTAVTIRAQVNTEAGRSFSLTKSPEVGLWVGILSFDRPGNYHLTGEAVDGVGNKGSRILAEVVVVPPVKITGDAQELKTARATLYNMSPETHAWGVWDAEAYGQHNAQLVDKGSLSLLVPAGEYYLRIAVPGSPDTLTRSFQVDQPTPLTGTLALAKPAGFKLGPVPVYWPWTALADPPLKATAATANGTGVRANTRLPLVSLATTGGHTVLPVDWYGKPTVLAVVATWAPTTSEQLPALETLAANTDVNVVLLAEQQRAETVAAYLQVAGSSLEAATDPDGVLSDTLSVSGIPALYFMDRHGIIKKVMVGARSADQILSELGRL